MLGEESPAFLNSSYTRNPVGLAIFKPDDMTAVVIALPAKGIDINEVQLAAIRKDKLIAVEGILTTTDTKLLVESCDIKGAKRVPILVAKTATWVDEKNKNKYPTENHITVRGVIRKVELKIGAESFDWGIENANGSIPFIPKEGKALDLGMKLVSGSLRMVDGRPIVKADKIEPVGK
jgi:hypothetical protein